MDNCIGCIIAPNACIENCWLLSMSFCPAIPVGPKSRNNYCAFGFGSVQSQLMPEHGCYILIRAHVDMLATSLVLITRAFCLHMRAYMHTNVHTYTYNYVCTQARARVLACMRGCVCVHLRIIIIIIIY